MFNTQTLKITDAIKYKRPSPIDGYETVFEQTTKQSRREVNGCEGIRLNGNKEQLRYSGRRAGTTRYSFRYGRPDRRYTRVLRSLAVWTNGVREKIRHIIGAETSDDLAIRSISWRNNEPYGENDDTIETNTIL